jgi:uncharacterized protein (DUF924 family)
MGWSLENLWDELGREDGETRLNTVGAKQVLDFWFVEMGSDRWFTASEEIDHDIARRFSALRAQAVRCELYFWRATPEGRLAEIIVLDQFSRNIFRNLPESFTADPLALALAQEAVHVGDDSRISVDRRAFLYMPFMHSESQIVHRIAVELFSAPGLRESLDYELQHQSIIDRFGRYPHRNQILGRSSTEEEDRFLAEAAVRF